MEKKEGNAILDLWNTLRGVFADENGKERKELEEQLAELQKVQAQIHEEKEKFGASLRVTTSGKAKKGKGIKTPVKNQVKKQEIERGE